MKRLLLLALFVSACGGDSPTSPSTPAPYNQTMTGTVSVFGTTRHALTLPRGGTMTLRLTWPDSTIDLDLYLTPPTCTELYQQPACQILAASDAATGAAEQIVRTVTSGEAFNIFVDNVDAARTQTYTLTLNVQ